MAVPATAEDTYDARGGAFGPISGPVSNAAAVTVHNTTELSYVTRAVYVGAAGTLKVTMQNGTAVSFVGVVAGTVLPIRCHIIWDDGTTADSIVALW